MGLCAPLEWGLGSVFFSITIEKTVATIFDVGLPGDIHISMYILMYIYEYTTARFARRPHKPMYILMYIYVYKPCKIHKPM